MDKFTNFIERKMMPLAQWVAANRYICALRDGFVYTIPFTIIGSFFMIIAAFPFFGVEEMLTTICTANGSGCMSDFLWAFVGVTFDILAIFVVLGISYHLAKHYKLDAFVVALISLVCFLLLTPGFTTTEAGEVVGGVIPKAWVGAQGLFVAIIAALGATELFRFCTNHMWTIKMPAGVPPTVASSFASLVPGAITLITFWVVYVVVIALTGSYVSELILVWLQMPLQAFGDSYVGLIAFTLAEHLLWSFGIHGSAVVSSVSSPINLANLAENVALAQAGIPVTLENGAKIVVDGINALYVNIGGSGCTLAIVLLMLTGNTKAARYKQLGKLAAPAAMFEINEPIIFGLPIVLNPIMIIPFIIVPCVAATVVYFAIASGFMPPIYLQMPWTMPPIISGLLTAGWQGATVQIINIILAGIIYYPFLRIMDKQAYGEEQAAIANE